MTSLECGAIGCGNAAGNNCDKCNAPLCLMHIKKINYEVRSTSTARSSAHASANVYGAYGSLGTVNASASSAATATAVARTTGPGCADCSRILNEDLHDIVTINKELPGLLKKNFIYLTWAQISCGLILLALGAAGFLFWLNYEKSPAGLQQDFTSFKYKGPQEQEWYVAYMAFWCALGAVGFFYCCCYSCARSRYRKRRARMLSLYNDGCRLLELCETYTQVVDRKLYTWRLYCYHASNLKTLREVLEADTPRSSCLV